MNMILIKPHFIALMVNVRMYTLTDLLDLGDIPQSDSKIVKLPFERMSGDRRQATSARTRSAGGWLGVT